MKISGNYQFTSFNSKVNKQQLQAYPSFVINKKAFEDNFRHIIPVMPGAVYVTTAMPIPDSYEKKKAHAEIKSNSIITGNINPELVLDKNTQPSMMNLLCGNENDITEKKYGFLTQEK